ncbi:MAG: hypothetical protein V4641_01950 [Pseudomonadota bacterium]
MPKLGLDRQQLASFLPNAEAIRAFEKVFEAVTTTPTTIEEVAALAGTAAALGNLALSLISSLSTVIEQLSTAPADEPLIEVDNFTPASVTGTLGQQNADSAEITGGTIDGTTIGATTASTGKFTTLSASGQITSTLATGTAPLVVASVTKVANLNADLLDGTDWAAPGTIGGTTPASASFTTIRATTSTVGLPGIYLSTENTTGLYRIGANNWGYAIAGVKAIDYGTTRIDYSINSLAILTKSFYCFSEQFGMGTPDSSGLQIFCGNADIMRFGHRSAGLVFTEDMRIDANGDVKVFTKFGCNGKAPQAAVAVGAALAAYAAGANGLSTGAAMSALVAKVQAIDAALIANGITV